MNLAERDKRVFVSTYARLPIAIIRGEGCYLFDVEGKRYLDLFGGLAVNALGYAHPGIVRAVETQVRRYTHLSNFFLQEPQIELAERLAAMSGYPRVYFCNSGTEATEAALKLARRWGLERGKRGLIGFTQGFHGRTTGALALMRSSKYAQGFGPLLEGSESLPYNDDRMLEGAVDKNTCAVFLECIQGESGVVPATLEFIATLRLLRERYGFLIVADEVQAGCGRTGKFLSCEHFDLQPDIVLMAKAIGGGLPLGAMLVREEHAEVFGIGGHGSTFGGNPVACAAGVAVIDEINERGLMEQASENGAYFVRLLRELEIDYPAFIREVRGRGMMIGIELYEVVGGLRERFMERGVCVNVTHGNIIRLLPPLILQRSHIDEAMEVFRAVFKEMSNVKDQM